ncbi:DUF262 domain-containing protein [Christiangramia forsetii]|uniref:Uncharacterized protein n=2 Tax=Christiangramia forsetii TaxID=411153 RepID=A0M4K0_CHRFK|nr:DUF262 domain-containing protein [Christiangramia forsetii]GGG23263.1 hypothetical protein GCM10011532_02980 [Christiangramia forsetii]CAL67545.1 conserved hypothetical protein [Christiangramia forsetii KT0803]
METVSEPNLVQNKKTNDLADLLEVGTIRVGQLLQSSNTRLIIPEFQRPYVWDERHIEELIKDWKDHFYFEPTGFFKEDAIEYFLGSVIIHENNGILEIIDGQQRITTLLIMDYVWNKDNSALEQDRMNLNYHSQISFINIKSNKNFLKSLENDQIAKDFLKIASKLVVSVVLTKSEDEAFIFFDSQNNRGVPLDEVDFFKSYHLRELHGKDVFLKHFARKFDQVNINSRSRNGHNNLNNLNELFIKMLWRIRYWSKGSLMFPKRRSILDTFQKNTLKFERNDEVRFYPNRNNMLGESLTIDENLNQILNSSINFSTFSGNALPFSVTQPIQKGIGFFLFTEKYDELYDQLFIKSNIASLIPINKLINQVHNFYFVNLYQITVVSFFDKYGEDKILSFALILEHMLGAYRMNRASIQDKSPIVLLRVYCNFLQVIQNSYLPTEVISEAFEAVPEDFYSGFKYNNEEILDSNGKPLSPARQNYYKAVINFYGPHRQNNIVLKNKKNWIHAYLNR